MWNVLCTIEARSKRVFVDERTLAASFRTFLRTKEAEEAKMDVERTAADGRPADAEAELRALAIDEDIGGDAEAIKRKEQAIAATVESLAARGDADGLRRLMHDLRPLYAKIAKAKTAKIVRQVIDAIAKIPGTKQLQVRAWRLDPT